MAEEADIDLVEIAPTAKPPVCRLMDYGKFKYRESKKAHEAKLKQKQIQVKEVKFRPGTDEGDYKIKVRNLIALPHRGRQDQGDAALPRPRDGAPGARNAAVQAGGGGSRPEAGMVEQWPKLEGRQMIMILAPEEEALSAVSTERQSGPMPLTPEVSRRTR